jgi:hypothetical protein
LGLKYYSYILFIYHRYQTYKQYSPLLLVVRVAIAVGVICLLCLSFYINSLVFYKVYNSSDYFMQSPWGFLELNQIWTEVVAGTNPELFHKIKNSFWIKQVFFNIYLDIFFPHTISHSWSILYIE